MSFWTCPHCGTINTCLLEECAKCGRSKDKPRLGVPDFLGDTDDQVVTQSEEVRE